jgi:hypothetical protein
MDVPVFHIKIIERERSGNGTTATRANSKAAVDYRQAPDFSSLHFRHNAVKRRFHNLPNAPNVIRHAKLHVGTIKRLDSAPWTGLNRELRGRTHWICARHCVRPPTKMAPPRGIEPLFQP